MNTTQSNILGAIAGNISIIVIVSGILLQETYPWALPFVHFMSGALSTLSVIVISLMTLAFLVGGDEIPKKMVEQARSNPDFAKQLRKSKKVGWMRRLFGLALSSFLLSLFILQGWTVIALLYFASVLIHHLFLINLVNRNMERSQELLNNESN